MRISESIRKAWPKIKLGLIIQLVGIAFSCLCVLTSGCATGYLADRAQDGADIFTVTAGVGTGIKAQTGPVALGLVLFADCAGIRAGEFFTQSPSDTDMDAWIPFPVYVAYDENHVIGWRSGFEWSEHGASRRKQIDYEAVWPYWIGGTAKKGGWTSPFPYQFEVIASLGVGCRLGFNPAELLDFILGWTTIDIFNDDLEWKKQKEKSNQPSERTSQ